MNTALLFDIDKTLTPPRLPINKRMVKIIERLTIPFHVAAGSHFDLLNLQFFKPMHEYGFRGQFDAFISNGAIHYHCDYSTIRGNSEFDIQDHIKLVSEFNILEHLGEEDYKTLIDTLSETLEFPQFQLPEPITVMGETIVDRVSMLNFSFI